jgi:hypothetical protein
MHAGCGCLGYSRPALLQILLIYSLIPGVSAKPNKLHRLRIRDNICFGVAACGTRG